MPISGMSSTNTNHRAFSPPDRSGLRKMSMNMVIRIQNQSTNRKTSIIVQKMLKAG